MSIDTTKFVKFSEGTQADFDNKLTDEQVETIAKSMNEAVEEDEQLSYIGELPSNCGSTERKPEDITETGYEATVNMAVDPVSGAMMPTAEDKLKESLDMSFEDLIASSNGEELEDEEFTEEDITKGIENDQDVFKDMNLSRDDTIELLHVVQRIQNKEKFNVFKALPESVQNTINEYMSREGIGQGYAPEVNSVRNDITEMLMNEFISNISINKVQEKYSEEMANLQEEINKELCDICMEYDKDRTAYIEKLIENTDDPEKKQVVADLLDAINDGFKLKRIKEYSKEHTIVIKKFETEKPNKVFDSFLRKYQKPTPNIYSIYDACNVLKRHLGEYFTDKQIVAYFVAFCKYTQNYKSEVPLEHAFMYYFIYNIMVMDIYKGEEYTKFINGYKNTMQELLDVIYIK